MCHISSAQHRTNKTVTLKQGFHFHAAGSQTLFFIWEKLSGTDHFKGFRLKHKLIWVRNLCRNPHFNEGSNSLISESKEF